MSATETTEATITVPAQDVKTAHLGTEGMHCASCVARIEQLVVAGLDLVVTEALGHCPSAPSSATCRRLEEGLMTMLDDKSPTERHDHDGRHGWMMIACRIPMLVIAVVLVATGVAGAGFIFAATICTAMMWPMMRGMSGSGSH
jgi:hypothetical protein